MIELYFIYNGHCKILIGSFGHIHSAINELKKHQASYSAKKRELKYYCMNSDTKTTHAQSTRTLAYAVKTRLIGI